MERDGHRDLFHFQIAVSRFAFRRGSVLVDLYGIFLAAVVADPQNPTALPIHILDEDILPVPLARNPHRNRNVRLTDGVGGDQQLLRERVPLLQVLDLLPRKVEGRARLLQHVLQALVRRLTGLETQIAHDLVLHFGRELPKGGRADVKVFGPHLLDERPELVLGRQARIGSNRPRRLRYALLEIDLRQSIRVVIVPAVLGFRERGRSRRCRRRRRCRRVVLSARRFGCDGRSAAHQVLQIYGILVYHDRPCRFLTLPFRRGRRGRLGHFGSAQGGEMEV